MRQGFAFAALAAALAAAEAASAESGRAAPAGAEDRFQDARDAMLETIEHYFELMNERTSVQTRLSGPVRAAISNTPRHQFVPASQQARAYEDSALPIEAGQTISQPFIVALMTELSGARRGARVLEVGAGSGYQAAVLAELGAQVYAIEIIPELAASAAERLARLGYHAVETRLGDGYAGWPEAAPFDAILVTAGADEIPAPLIAQLAPGGRLVMPVGPHGAQELLVLTKDAGGAIRTEAIIPVAFVPLTRSE